MEDNPVILFLVAFLVLGGIIFGVFFVVNRAINDYQDIKADKINPACVRTELVSIKTGQKTQGNLSGGFFLVFGAISGSVSSSPVYRFFQKNSDNSYVLGERNGDSLIYEDEEKNPYLKDCGKYEIKSEFHIPKGSIISDYKLSL